jgi:hypothetical protein
MRHRREAQRSASLQQIVDQHEASQPQAVDSEQRRNDDRS